MQHDRKQKFNKKFNIFQKQQKKNKKKLLMEQMSNLDQIASNLCNVKSHDSYY